MIPKNRSQDIHAANARPAHHGRKPADAPAEAKPGGAQMNPWSRLVMNHDWDGISQTSFITNPELLAEAPKWRPGSDGMSGSEANETITRYYTYVDEQMAYYLGEPSVANWATFAKYASREAGDQIHRLEAFLNVAHGHSPHSLLALCDEFLAQPGAMSGQLKLLWEHSSSPADFMNKVQHLRDVLVAGNTGIIRDIVPAFKIFLGAELGNHNGVKALEAQGFGKAPRDPDGFLLDTFKHYKAARQISRQLKALPDMHSPEAQKLLAERAHHVAAANLRLGFQEQWVTLQKPDTFGDPVVNQVMAALTPSMSLTDATGTHELLPNGGNWANFADRMGLIEVDPAQLPADKRNKVYTVADAAGKKHHYTLNPDRQAREGSIFQVFAAVRSPEQAKTLIDGKTREYSEAYDHADAGLKGLWTGVKGLFKRP
jgi:hypothetical protein